MSDQFPQEEKRSTDDAKVVTTLRSVEEHYQRMSHLYSTRTADAYHARDKNTGEEVLLWSLRHPLGVQTEASQRYSNRLDVISRLTGATVNIRVYGVDTNGIPFLVTDFIEGIPLVEMRAGAPVLGAHFFDSIKKVATLHQRGIVLGDICDHSFLIERTKSKIQLISILGTFDVEASQTALMPPPNTLHYVSPEQRSGGGLDLGSDVYALGVLGYRLFTGRYLFGDRPPMLGTEEELRLVPAPSVIASQIPNWADDIIGKCVEAQPSKRFRDAPEIVAAIERAIKTGLPPGGDGRWSQKTLVVTPNASKALGRRQSNLVEPRVQQPPEPEVERKTIKVSSTGMGVLFGALVVGVALAGGVAFFVQNWRSSGGLLSTEFPIQLEDAPPELGPYLTDFFSEKLPASTRKEALAKLSQSEGLYAYAALLSAVKHQNPEIRAAGEQYSVERMRRLGMTQAADFLPKWFPVMENARTKHPESNLTSWIMTAAEPELPFEARKSAVNKIYGVDTLLGLQVAAASALDAPDDTKLTSMLRDLLQTAQPGVKDLDGKGVGALVLSSKSLSLFFSQGILTQIQKFSVSDLTWAMNHLAENDSILVKDLGNELIQRNAIPPFQAVFLKRLVNAEKFELSQPVKKALVNGTRGEVGERDVIAIGKWWSLEAEPVLLSMCALARDPETQLSAFDTLAARDAQSEPAKTFIAWVKNNLWEDRARVVKAVGILGHLDLASSEQVEYAFDLLMPFAGRGDFLTVIVRTNVPRLILSTLDRVGSITSSDDLLSLLSFSDKEVRIAAVKTLKGRNDLAVLQSILRAYEAERDEDVRRVYREMHWVTQERS